MVPTDHHRVRIHTTSILPELGEDFVTQVAVVLELGVELVADDLQLARGLSRVAAAGEKGQCLTWPMSEAEAVSVGDAEATAGAGAVWEFALA